MIRHTPLRRARMKRRPTFATAKEIAWREQHESCAACHAFWRDFGVVMTTHHILGGRDGRPDFEWNFLRLCAACHSILQGGRKNKAVCLRLKRESDPENYNRAAMQEHSLDILPPMARRLPWWVSERRLRRNGA